MASADRIRSPDRPALLEAADLLRRGGLVVFPTETVYGVGAHALDPVAVARIFAAKGRPPDNPLILHVVDVASARTLAARWPKEADRLAQRFWPGPLTLVLPKAPHVPLVATAGLDTVAVRVPSHPVAAALLREAGLPVAAPSANRSGSPSPTRVADAVNDLGDEVDLYLDGGATPIGVESTVVSLLEGGPKILRPGAIARHLVEQVTGTLVPLRAEDVAHSPGTRHRHYAPRAKLHLVPSASGASEQVRLERSGLRVALVAPREHATAGPHVRVPGAAADAEAWARTLYALLRDLDQAGYDAIVVEEIPEAGLGEAVRDRLRRAAED